MIDRGELLRTAKAMLVLALTVVDDWLVPLQALTYPADRDLGCVLRPGRVLRTRLPQCPQLFKAVTQAVKRPGPPLLDLPQIIKARFTRGFHGTAYQQFCRRRREAVDLDVLRSWPARA